MAVQLTGATTRQSYASASIAWGQAKLVSSSWFRQDSETVTATVCVPFQFGPAHIRSVGHPNVLLGGWTRFGDDVFANHTFEVSRGAWHLAVIHYDGTTWKVLIDGEEKISLTNSNGLFATNAAVSIHGAPVAGRDYSLGESAVWASDVSVPSEAEVAAYFADTAANPISGFSVNPTAWYDFLASGDGFNDKSGNGHHLVLVDGTAATLDDEVAGFVHPLTVDGPYVPTSGEVLILPFKDGAGNAVEVSAGTGAPTLTNVTTSTTAVLGEAYFRGNRYAIWIIDEASRPAVSDVLEVDLPAGLVVDDLSNGSRAETDAAVTNSTGVELLPAVGSGTSTRFRFGQNINQPNYFMCSEVFTDRARQQSTWNVEPSYVDAATGLPTPAAGVDHGTVNGLYWRWDTDIGVPATPGGQMYLFWTPNTAQDASDLVLTGDAVEIANDGGTTGRFWDGSRWQRKYDIPVDGRFELQFDNWGSDLVSVEMVPPAELARLGVETYTERYLERLKDVEVLRFMDSSVTNSSNLHDVGDLTPAGFHVAGGKQRKSNVDIVSITDVTAAQPDAWFEGRGGTVAKVTTAAAHGFGDGDRDHVLNSSGLVIGGDAITDLFKFSLHVLSTTEFTIHYGKTGGVSYTDPGEFEVRINGGMSAEDKAQLATELPSCTLVWDSLWHGASDATLTGYFGRMNAALPAGVDYAPELSNEIWNGAGGFLGQHDYCYGNAQLDPDPDVTSFVEYQVKRSAEIFALAQAEFGARAKHIIAGHDANSGDLEARLAFAALKGYEVDYVAVAAYMPHPDLADYTKIGPGGVIDILHTELETIGRDNWLACKAVADAHGVPLIIYECGQHLFPGDGDAAQEAAKVDVFVEATAHPRMGNLYWLLGRVLNEDVGVEFAVHYDIGKPWGSDPKFGTWGMYQKHDQVPGVGDGSDGLNDNVANPDRYDTVSTRAFAVDTWNATAVAVDMAAIFAGDSSGVVTGTMGVPMEVVMVGESSGSAAGIVYVPMTASFAGQSTAHLRQLAEAWVIGPPAVALSEGPQPPTLIES